MDPLTILTTVAGVISQLVQIGPTVIKGIEDAKPFAQEIITMLTGGNTDQISQADLDKLTASIAALSAQLQTPLPDAQPGDPDYVKPA